MMKPERHGKMQAYALRMRSESLVLSGALSGTHIDDPAKDKREDWERSTCKCTVQSASSP